MSAPPAADPEFALLAGLTRRPVDTSIIRESMAGGSSTIDWRRFVALVERHRVGPLIFGGLADVPDMLPDPVRDDLRAIARRDRIGALAGVAALTLAVERLSAAGISSLSIKGPTLAILAFGDASARQFKDIDILIDRDDLERAMAVLAMTGFRLLKPAGAADPDRLRSWAKLMKDATLVHEPTGTLVELHWRLNQNPYLLRSAVRRSRHGVALGTQQVDTLAPDDLLLYLCVHGAEHFWFRLKWLADVAALLTTRSPAEIAAFHDTARSSGLGGPAGQMLLMVERVYGVAIPDDIRASALRSWRVRLLTRFAVRALHRRDEVEATRFVTTMQAVGHMLLRPGLDYVGRELLDLLIDWPVALALSRSRWAIPVAIAGRPLFWLARKVRPASW